MNIIVYERFNLPLRRQRAWFCDKQCLYQNYNCNYLSSVRFMEVRYPSGTPKLFHLILFACFKRLLRYNFCNVECCTLHI